MPADRCTGTVSVSAARKTLFLGEFQQRCIREDVLYVWHWRGPHTKTGVEIKNKEMIKKSRKKPITPRSQIRSALRRLWLRSRERNFRLQLDKYTCQGCFKKQSKAKGKEFFVEIHHLAGVGNWELIINEIYKELLVSPEKLVTLCPRCHDLEEEE